MKKFLMVFVMLVCLVGLAYASVEIKSNDTVTGKTETLNIKGATISQDGTDIIVDVSNLKGLGARADASIYVDKSLYVDGAIYVTRGAGVNGGIYLPQRDGGCSFCDVNNAGTTFSCIDITCPKGM
jgi:hypothetical protein